MKQSRFRKLLLALTVPVIFLWVIYTGTNLNTRIYRYAPPRAFEGSKYYNPYQSLDARNWHLANFHAHARCWKGITHGYDSREDIIQEYAGLQYDIITVSDYLSLPENGPDKGTYLTAYEHGLNMGKQHQIVINARSVNWLDFIFPQHIHNKQTVIESLKEDSFSVVALAHPSFQSGYSTEDLMRISGYDLMEVMNHRAYSFAEWDAALSAGRPAFILADDDLHELADRAYLARCATLIFAKELTADDILSGLRQGQTAGVEIYNTDIGSIEAKRADIRSLERWEKLSMQGDTLSIGWQEPVKTIRFIGQNGVEKAVVENQREARYVFDKNDPYIRTEVTTQRGHRFFFNPVMRTTGKMPVMPKAQVAPLLSFLYKLSMLILLLGVLLLWWRMFK